MAKNAIPSYADLNKAIKAVADIPSKVDDEGFVIADGVSLTKNVYDPKNGNYELHVRDVKNNKWKSFDNYDNANCIEDAAKCFVDFYKARSTSESHKCSMAKKIESLSKKNEAVVHELEFVDIDNVHNASDFDKLAYDAVLCCPSDLDVDTDSVEQGVLDNDLIIKARGFNTASFDAAVDRISQKLAGTGIVLKVDDVIKNEDTYAKQTESHKCSMAKKIESLRKRSEGIDDVVNANDAAAKDKYNSGNGRYGKAQDILNFNTQHSDWKASKFLRTYVMDKYDVDWTTDHTKESYKLWFKDKRKVQDLINMFVEYRPKDGWNSNMSAKDFKIGRSVVVCPSRVELLIDDVYSNCPEWQQAFKEYLGTEVRAPIKDLKREVDYERSRSPEYNKFLTDIKDFKAELTDVIRNAVKLRTEVNYYPPRHEDDTEPFRVAIDGGFNDSASKSVTKVLNDLNAKYNPVPGGKRVDKDAAAEVLAALEASLS